MRLNAESENIQSNVMCLLYNNWNLIVKLLFRILHWRVFSSIGKWQSPCLVNRYIWFLLVVELFPTRCVFSLHWELNYCLWNMTHCCIYIFPSHQFEDLATLHYCFLLLAINEWWSSLESACTIHSYNVNVMKWAEQNHSYQTASLFILQQPD